MDPEPALSFFKKTLQRPESVVLLSFCPAMASYSRFTRNNNNNNNTNNNEREKGFNLSIKRQNKCAHPFSDASIGRTVSSTDGPSDSCLLSYLLWLVVVLVHGLRDEIHWQSSCRPVVGAKETKPRLSDSSRRTLKTAKRPSLHTVLTQGDAMATHIQLPSPNGHRTSKRCRKSGSAAWMLVVAEGNGA